MFSPGPCFLGLDTLDTYIGVFFMRHSQKKSKSEYPEYPPSNINIL